LIDSRLILVIEDNPGDIRLMKEALREAGPDFVLEFAADGEQALRFLNREHPYENSPRPSLIFLDLNLPKGTSRDILRYIKSSRDLFTIPVAVLTSSSSDEDVREVFALHANCYLRKPVDLDNYLKTIRSTIEFWTRVAYSPQA
jgi:CheY-like chemotaxis protein